LFACIPILLLVKPIILKCQERKLSEIKHSSSIPQIIENNKEENKEKTEINGNSQKTGTKNNAEVPVFYKHLIKIVIDASEMSFKTFII